jgi:hypothetical protein
MKRWSDGAMDAIAAMDIHDLRSEVSFTPQWTTSLKV